MTLNNVERFTNLRSLGLGRQPSTIHLKYPCTGNYLQQQLRYICRNKKIKESPTEIERQLLTTRIYLNRIPHATYENTDNHETSGYDFLVNQKLLPEHSEKQSTRWSASLEVSETEFFREFRRSEAIWFQHLYGNELGFVQRQATLLLLGPKSCP